MKKVLSLVLAVVLVCGMSTVAFAATQGTNKVAVAEGQLTYYVNGMSNYTKGKTHEAVLYGGDANGGDYWNWFDADGYARADETLKLYLDPAEFTNTAEKAAIDEGYGSLKSYLLAYNRVKQSNTALVSGLTTSRLSSANISVKKKVSKGSDIIDDIQIKNETNTVTYYYLESGSNIYETTSTLYSDAVKNGDFAVNARGEVVARGSSSVANTLNLDEKYTIAVPYKTVYVQIDLIEYFVSTGDKDFDFTIYLAEKSTRIPGTTVQIGGTIKNHEILVEEDDDEVDLSDGKHYVKADDYVKNITIEAGDGLFINTKMFSGSKYYAVAVQELTSSDDAIITRYPEIDTVYTLYTVNMNSASNTVEIDVDDTYYVYDASGKYIGTTADKLPMSSKYYLAVSQIDMGATDVDGDASTTTDVPVDSDGSLDNAVTGGDDVPANANDNPGTGR